MAGTSAQKGRRRPSSAQPEGALKPRGLKSRKRLKDSARAVLNDKGYRQMRVQDVTAHAGVANGLFYRYFRDLREVVAEIASDFFTELVEASRSLDDYSDPFEWIYRNHSAVVDRFARNPGILACLFGLSGDYEEFDRIWKDNAHRWNLQVAEFLQSAVSLDQTRAENLAYVLGAMTEGVIYQALIRHTEDLVKFGKRPEDVAEIISVMWYRAIFLRDPAADKLTPAGRRLTNGSVRAD